MKPPRRSTRSKKSNSRFSSTEWKLEGKNWTSESKRLGKAAKTTCTQDVTAKPSDGRQDITKRDIRGADFISDTEERSPIISDVKSVGYPSSTDSHSITEKSRSADGNCGNVNKRNGIKEKTQLAKSTDMNVKKRKKAGGNGNIVMLKKAGKNKTEIDVNPNMENHKKMKRQNEDSNIINSESHYKDDNSFEDILNEEASVDICQSLEDEKLKYRQESGAFVEENGGVTDQTKPQCVPLDSSGNTLNVNNASLGHSTKDTPHLSNESQVLLGQMKNFGCGQVNYEKDKFLNNQTIKEEILNDYEVQIEDNPEFQLTSMILIKAEVETESGESDMRSHAGDMESRANDLENSSGIICDLPSAIPSSEPHSTDNVSFQPMQNVTVNRPRSSVIMETPRGTISRDGPHEHDTIGMDVSQHTIDMDHDYAKIASHPPNVTGVVVASGIVHTPTRYLTTETAEARKAVSSQEGARIGVVRERELRAGLEVVVPSVGVDDQLVGGDMDGSRSQGVNHSVDNNDQEVVRGAVGSRLEVVNYSVENQAPAQAGNSSASGYCGACRGNDKMKIKMEIELSTAQFIKVAHVLPMLGSATNAE